MPRTRPDTRASSWCWLAASLGLSLYATATQAQSDATGAAPAQHASDPAARRYSLQQLIELALNENPSFHEAEQGALQAHLETSLVRSQYAPQLNIKTLAGNEHTPLAITRNVSPRGYIVSTSREIIPSLQLKWLLLDFGRKKNQVEASMQMAQAADASLLGAEEKLVFEVSKAYFDASAAQGKVRAADKALHAAQLTEQAVIEQRHHGRATVVQVAQAHRQTAAMQLAQTRATGDAQTALATLVATVGLSANARVELDDAGDVPAEPEAPPALDTLIATALNSRPDIIAAQAHVAAAAADVQAARSAYHPTLSIEAQVFQNIGKTSSDNSPFSSINMTGNSVFVAFEVPLFDGGGRATKVALARSKRDEAEDALSAAKLAATQQVTQSYNDLRTSLANREQALDYTRAAELAYQASLDAYRHGLSSITDLTSDEAALAQAQSNQEDADAGVQIARAAVALAVGQRTSR
ncbi:TolC family protein [Dyella japonica]|uniref:Protein CyaE n=1 Tax=Dyella japonica TaxID=231455 RepID=A0ABV2JNZ6_9GAMM